MIRPSRPLPCPHYIHHPLTRGGPKSGGRPQTPVHIAVSPDGKNAYVASFNGAVWQYTIDPVTGGLSPKNPATVAAGRSPWDVAVTPDGKSAYVTNYGDNTVSEYDINPLTGTLSPKTGAPWMIGGDSRSRFRPEQGFWSSERRVEVACASAAGLWTARWAPCPAIVGTADACSSGQGWPRLRAGASG